MKAVLFLVISAIVILTPLAFSANDRPLIFGQNPIPTNWWGYDKNTYDPVEFDKMQQAGCSSARIGVNWDQIEPTRGIRSWGEIDRWVKLCVDRGINPVILINSTPTWALPDNVNPEIPVPEARYPCREDMAADFESFVFELARRYRGLVQYYEFWNEANGYGWHWDEGYHRLDEYTPWMVRAYKQIKLADPTAKMSTSGWDDNGGAGDYDVERLYDYGGKGYFDAVADHPYSPGQIEEWKITDIINKLNSMGDTNKTIWITEMGWPANGRESTVAGWITDYFNKLVNNHPRVTIATYHTAMDFPWEDVGYGLIDKNFNTKVTWEAFRNYVKPARPVIGNFVVTKLSASSVRISFTTDIQASAMIMYGPTDKYGLVTGKDSPSQNHSFTLIGLSPGTTYHYRVRAGAGEYADTYSADKTFTTNSGSVVQITSGPTVSSITETSAVVSWTTNVASSSVVEYGTTFSYGNTASVSGNTTNHVVILTSLQPETNYQFRVISSASGYADASKEGIPFRTLALPGNLKNGSFEDGGSEWRFWEVYPWGYDGNGDGQPDYPGHVSVYTFGNGALPPSPAVKDGNKRLTHDRGYASGIGGMYQTIRAENTTYIVSGWIAAGCDGGDELVELRAIDGKYTGGIPGGTALVSLNSSANWTWFAVPVRPTSGFLTLVTRVSQYSAVGVVSGHFDGISVTKTKEAAVQGIKNMQVGDLVSTNSAKVVTMVVDSYTFYIQEDDRSSGIKVHTSLPHGLSRGQRTFVAGYLAVGDGEALIDNAWVFNPTEGTEPEPLAMANKAVGGGSHGCQPAIADAVGLNNTGLLVRTWGRYTKINNTTFTVDDGSGTPIQCVVPTGVSLPTNWQYVTVTGISSCYVENGNIRPMIRVRSASDITHVP